MPRILLKISTRNRIKARAYKQPNLPSERLWLSIAGLSSPYPTTAALSRNVNPPTVIARPPVATLASSLSGRPAFIEVKPQISKKRKRGEATTNSDSGSSFNDDASVASSIIVQEDSGIDLRATVDPTILDPSPLDPSLFDPALFAEKEPSPVPVEIEEEDPVPTEVEEEEEEDDLPIAPKRRRTSLDLAPSSLLLSPPSERPTSAKFSPGQLLWANSMLSAVMDGKVLAGEEYASADCGFLVQAVLNGVLEVEKDHIVEMGMDGHARDENMVKFDAFLAECLEKEEVVVAEQEVIDGESSEEEMSDAEEVVDELVDELVEELVEEDGSEEEVLEEVVEYFSDEEEEQVPVVAVHDSSSSSDEEFSSEEED